MDDEIEPADADERPTGADSSPLADEVEPDATRVEHEAVATPAPSAPRPPAPAASGLPAVDAAVEQLGSLDELPVDAHVEVFDDAQRRLHDALAELDDEQ